jgi:hypothetical protein
MSYTKEKVENKSEAEAEATETPRAPRKKTLISLSVGGQKVKLLDIQNDAVITVGDLKLKEGSKRSERAKALEGCKTVQDYLINDGLTRDLMRYLTTGAVTLSVKGKPVEVEKTVVEVEPKVEQEEVAAE